MILTPVPAWRQKVRAVLLMLAAFVAAAAAGRAALAAGLRHSDPARAASIAPKDARALTLLADGLQRRDRAQDRQQIAALARRALRAGPLDAQALRILAFAEEGRSAAEDRAVSRRIALSRRLSRRDVPAALWTIEDAVRREDAAAALATYDSVLRMAPGTSAILFPILVGALEEPEIRARLSPYLRADPPWMLPLAKAAAGSAPRDFARVVLAAGGLPRTARYQGIQPALLTALVAADAAPLARLLTGRTIPGGQALLAEPGFAQASVDANAAPLAWDPRQGGDHSAGFERSGASVMLSASVGTQASRPLAARVVFLKPGNYTLAAKFETVAGAGAIGWLVRCTGKSDAPIAQGGATLDFTVPRGCGAQWLEIQGRSSGSQFGYDVRIGPVALRKRV